MEKSRYKLADVIESWTSGDWGEEIPSSECCNKVCCIRSADIVPIYNNSFEIATTRYISDKSFNKNLLKVGDIIEIKYFKKEVKVEVLNVNAVVRKDQAEEMYEIIEIKENN